ncbi:MAG: VanW family protein [Anaerolineaceae bacterium]|nr:VanW family protein [Anaerolineaceae bacterium]
MNTKSMQNTVNPKMQLAFVLIFGILLAAIVGTAWVYAYENKYNGRIYPGVSVAGIDLSNLTEGEAALKLKQEFTYTESGRLLFSDKDNKWMYNPSQMGLSLDALATANAAYRFGREGNLLTNLGRQIAAHSKPYTLAPSLLFDQKQAYENLQHVAEVIDKPTLEAGFSLNNTEVTTTSGQIGRQLDISASLKLLSSLILNVKEGSIPLVVKETPPAMMEVGPSADLARKVLSMATTLKMPEDGPKAEPWRIEPETMAKLLTIALSKENGKTVYALVLNPDLLRNYLSSLAPNVQLTAKNARAIFNEETRKLEILQPSVTGYSLDLDASIQSITKAVLAGNHESTLVFKVDHPSVSDSTDPASLGITELVAENTSYFYGSSRERLQNIAAAAASFKGVFVPPNSVFSMGDYLTDISLENGYAEGLIIYGNQTVKGVGGGVCQVSTTLFRNVFLAGFPIVERHPHAYRVGYYEQDARGYADPNRAGLDATVYLPLVDLKFKNDTPYWMVMDTEMGDYSLTWKIWSTKDGRTVDVSSTGIMNIQPPPEPIYRENPELPKDTIKQMDWAVEGASVDVYRTVYKDGAPYFSDTIHTNYQPWPDAFDFGPGTELPDGVKPAR